MKYWATHRIVVLLITAAVAALLWWPHTVRSRVVLGETGKPLVGAKVLVYGDVLKPWWPLAAIGQTGNISNRVTRSSHSNENGEFQARLFAGVRLQTFGINFVDGAHAVNPSLFRTGQYTSSDDERRQHFGEPTILSDDRPFIAWPVTDNLEVDDSSQATAPGDEESEWLLGKQQQKLFVRFERADKTVTIRARWHDGEIRSMRDSGSVLHDDLYEWTSLVAPLDGYQPEAATQSDCRRRSVFFVRSDAGNYGWIAMDLHSLCNGENHVYVEYRLSNAVGVRALVTTGR